MSEIFSPEEQVQSETDIEKPSSRRKYDNVILNSGNNPCTITGENVNVFFVDSTTAAQVLEQFGAMSSCKAAIEEDKKRRGFATLCAAVNNSRPETKNLIHNHNGQSDSGKDKNKSK